MSKTKWVQDLHSQHGQDLMQFASRLVTPGIATEFVQESFLRLLKQDQSSLLGREREWLFVVCKNLALDYLKREGGPKAEFRSIEIASEQPLADRQISDRQERDRVREAISRLTERHRKVLLLKFEDGLSYKEISSTTGFSISYIGVLIHEAVVEIKLYLGEQRGRT